ncbi:hypothetical protein F5876DRAFT_84107 [Lentinula aff. lateritia]|uniref:Uncharacterized protein n=1 Tax=Lentinula aff. lateritia TaxID=2804960 RepID=A0ACC1TH55_9AGAR|nr:hypothetical protein F5876DRAFT_84107 [Lentinula aff. lateritia]
MAFTGSQYGMHPGSDDVNSGPVFLACVKTILSVLSWYWLSEIFALLFFLTTCSLSL